MSVPPHPNMLGGRATPPAPPSANAATAGGSSSTPRAMGVGHRTPQGKSDPGHSMGTACEGSSTLGGGGGVGSGGKTASKPKSDWKKCWDYKQAATYYKHVHSKESRWANAEDPVWMEATDPASGHIFLEHATTGETMWKAEQQYQAAVGGGGGGDCDKGAGPGPTKESGGRVVGEAGSAAATSKRQTVWEEIKEPGSGVRYYFSSVSESSQWHPPVWMDYVDTKENVVYYVNTRTNESLWEKPAGFVAVATEEDPAEASKRGITLHTAFNAFQGKAAAGTQGVGAARSRAPSPSSRRPSLPGGRGRNSCVPGGVTAASRRGSAQRSGVIEQPPLPTPPTVKSKPLSPPQRDPKSSSGGKDNSITPPKPPARTAGSEFAPPPPPREETPVPPASPPHVRGEATPAVTGVASKGEGGATAFTSSMKPVMTRVPSPPTTPKDGSPAAGRSPRGSVPPPPGPPPAENLPAAVEESDVDSGEEHGDGGNTSGDDEDGIDREAGSATG
ncbi:unnamed protein product [Ectocarpus sp. 12 AP-2014]